MSSRALLVRPLARAVARRHGLPHPRFMSTPLTSSSSSSPSVPPSLNTSDASSASSIPQLPPAQAPVDPLTPSHIGGSPSKPPSRKAEPNWLARYLLKNPRALRLFLKFTNVAGYGSPRQLAARRALALYERTCAGRPEEEMDFWQKECDLPPTFQSWFTVTNLHVWLLTVRLRALPKGPAQDHIQGLIDHFFFDVEDRIRLVLSPAPKKSEPATPAAPPSASPSAPSTQTPEPARPGLKPFYTTRSGEHTYSRAGVAIPVRPAPERLVGQQMKVFREQWAGFGLALDHALVAGDTELASTIWRNLLGARGARGITLPGEQWDGYRRSINLVGGNTRAVRLVDALPGGLEAAERKDDNSGVHDYSPEEVDKYVPYPETMLALARYIRRELQRLERLSDADVLGPQPDSEGVLRPGREREGVDALRFGSVRG